MIISQVQNENKFIIEDNKIIGELIYSYVNRDKVTLDSTWIDEDYRGNHLGAKLLDEFISFVRESNLTVIPVCSFSKKIFSENPEKYKDILK